MKNLIIILTIIITPFFSYSQIHNNIENEKCGTEIITKNLEKKYSEYKKQRSKVNEQTEHWLLKNSNKQNVHTSRYRVKKSNFSGARGITWGGPRRPWEYPEPIPDASGGEKYHKKYNFQKIEKIKICNF